MIPCLPELSFATIGCRETKVGLTHRDQDLDPRQSTHHREAKIGARVTCRERKVGMTALFREKKVSIGVQSVSDATVCKVFPSTLSDAAQKWYQNLKEGSINRESLKAYVARFNAEVIMIEDLNDDTAIDAMKDNTSMQRKAYGTASPATSKPPSTPGSSRTQDRYRPLNETSGYRGGRPADNQTSSPSTGPGTKPSFSIGGGTEGYVDRAGVARQYVPLNTPREQILAWIKHNNEEIRYPPRLVKDGNRYKFCDFHDGYGHETEKCGRLRSEIDKLVCQGRLQHFVVAKEGHDRGNTRVNSVRSEPSGSREAAPPSKKTQVTGVINTISGGTLESDYIRRRRKKKQKMVMTVFMGSPWSSIVFGPEDAKGVEFPHEDALIISAIVGQKWVKRLLVDDGSSVNLLTLPVFLEMGGSRTDLKPVSIPVLGLGGAPLCPEGMVELDLELGVEIPQEDGTEGVLAEPTRKVRSLFMVVDMPLAYNGIFGRPMLYSTGAVTSIRYLMMKIPVESEVITIRGNQALSRQCYMATMGKDEHRYTRVVAQREKSSETSGKLGNN
ncbi:uncharacterized protein LOC126672186 [Mercurialis annua]|uniref:uncharacterized protein LOC126672186 n=1 Tax=Mercurialis annua TaxID=3986 RepID=UPI0021610997|nr:uncharacterized protein LOC126672186 [Mercurialis annua]